MTLARLQLLEEPLKLLPLCRVRGRAATEGEEDAGGDEKGEEKAGEEGELERVAELLPRGGLVPLLVLVVMMMTTTMMMLMRTTMMYLHLVGQAMVEEVGGDEEEGEDEDPPVGEVVRPQQRGLEGLPDLLRLCPGFPRAVGVLHVGDEEDVDGN